MRDPDPFPTSVDLDRAANVLTIAWEDGAQTRYTGEQLRWACPCAECRGEGGSPGRLDEPGHTLKPEDAKLENAGLIGQYALQLGFQSGHDTGLYTFRYLRSLSA